MSRRSRNMMTIGAMGALAGLMIFPVVHAKSRRKFMRMGRNAYFKASDIFNDIKDMRK